eukprot:COSAG02_NODE_60163_length_272_cov_0.595376_1_plen_37_part_10
MGRRRRRRRFFLFVGVLSSPRLRDDVLDHLRHVSAPV